MRLAQRRCQAMQGEPQSGRCLVAMFLGPSGPAHWGCKTLIPPQKVMGLPGFGVR